jgi:hypothetical protein
MSSAETARLFLRCRPMRHFLQRRRIRRRRTAITGEGCTFL